MLRHFERLLTLFPYSQLAARGPVLRVYAVERTEPSQLEREFPRPVEAAAMIAAAREFAHADSSIEVDAFWDLWRFDGDWNLSPSTVTLICNGPEFESEAGDHLRIEFGPDAAFLPIKGVERSLRMGQSNLRSVVRLIADIEKSLPLESRQLWSESGTHFSEVLAETIGEWDN